MKVMCMHGWMRLCFPISSLRDLASKSDGKADPFATLFYGKEQHNTQVSILESSLWRSKLCKLGGLAELL